MATPSFPRFFSISSSTSLFFLNFFFNFFLLHFSAFAFINYFFSLLIVTITAMYSYIQKVFKNLVSQSWACVPEMPLRLASVPIFRTASRLAPSRGIPNKKFAHSCFRVIAHRVCIFTSRYFRAPDLLRVTFAPLIYFALYLRSLRPLFSVQVPPPTLHPLSFCPGMREGRGSGLVGGGGYTVHLYSLSPPLK